MNPRTLRTLRRAFVVGLLLVTISGGGVRLLACGDKYLMIGLQTRYERSPAERQAAGILLYANAGSDLSRTLSALSVEAKMKSANYRPTVVSSAADFDAVLQKRTWDVVVVDGKDSEAVSRRLSDPGGPRVVPVLTKPTKDELSRARKLYRIVVNTPTKSGVFVDTIEDAMDLHEAEVDAARRTAKKGDALKMRQTFAVVAVALVVFAAGVRPVSAQAWLPRAGQGDVTGVSQMIDHVGRLVDDGTRVACCGTTNVTLAADVDYGITDRWSVSADMPYVFAKYRGEAPSGPAAFLPYPPADSCHCLNSSFQDLGVATRYNLVRVHRSFMLTPSISFGAPSHAYDHVGEAVVGFGLRQMGMGVDVGQRLDVLLTGLSVQGRYTYTIVPRVLDISHNRSNVAAEGAYSFNRQLSGHALFSWQRTHGGLRFPADVEPFPERYDDFHRLLQDNYFQAGAAASYSLHKWDVSASFLRAVSGTNSHDVHVYTVSVGHGFRIGG